MAGRNNQELGFRPVAIQQLGDDAAVACAFLEAPAALLGLLAGTLLVGFAIA
jgi:hypothetical protein